MSERILALQYNARLSVSVRKALGVLTGCHPPPPPLPQQGKKSIRVTVSPSEELHFVAHAFDVRHVWLPQWEVRSVYHNFVTLNGCRPDRNWKCFEWKLLRLLVGRAKTRRLV